MMVQTSTCLPRETYARLEVIGQEELFSFHFESASWPAPPGMQLRGEKHSPLLNPKLPESTSK